PPSVATYTAPAGRSTAMACAAASGRLAETSSQVTPVLMVRSTCEPLPPSTASAMEDCCGSTWKFSTGLPEPGRGPRQDWPLSDEIQIRPSDAPAYRISPAPP